MTQRYQLAQLNVGRAVAPLDSPAMAGFMNQLDRINALAEASPGFVWRFQDESGNATSVRAFDDPRVIVNMSVWESQQALHDYVYRSEHVRVLRKRKQWFEKFDGPFLVLWWVPAGHRPTLAEAKAKLDLLTRQGPSAAAFTFGKSFPPPNVTPDAETVTAMPPFLSECPG